ncbi:MAG: hypothetical protein KAS98_05910, partial [Deltaproteobacteria bacterium]|nr:hypothetical protein [Deltaproteobacteria bacterium]
PYLIRGGNDTFFLIGSILACHPCETCPRPDRGAGIQELIDNLSIIDMQIIISLCLKVQVAMIFSVRELYPTIVV